MEELLDQELLCGYIDSLGPDVVEQMVDLYVQQSSLYLSDIEKAVIAESNSLWHSHCHKMKGAAASAGLKQLHQRLAAVDQSKANVGEKKAILEELQSLNTNGVIAIKQWVSNI